MLDALHTQTEQKAFDQQPSAAGHAFVPITLFTVQTAKALSSKPRVQGLQLTAASQPYPSARRSRSLLRNEPTRWHGSSAQRLIRGGGERNRTVDLLLAKQALSQLSYTPKLKSGAAALKLGRRRPLAQRQRARAARYVRQSCFSRGARAPYHLPLSLPVARRSRSLLRNELSRGGRTPFDRSCRGGADQARA